MATNTAMNKLPLVRCAHCGQIVELSTGCPNIDCPLNRPEPPPAVVANLPPPKPVPPPGLTAREKDWLLKTADLWNEYCALDERTDPHDAEAVMFHIHALQAIMAVRVAQRVDAAFWRQPK